MPPWIFKIPALIRAYGPALLQGILALQEVVRGWRKPRAGRPPPSTHEEKDG